MSIKKYLSKNLTTENNLRLTNVMSSVDKLSSDYKKVTTLTPGCELENKILIGTHHKTGTVWLNSVFKTISQFHDLKFNHGREVSPTGCDIYLHDHSIFDFNAIDFPYKGMHIIRDPRDVIVSGFFYHQKSEESWLHEPREEFDGLSFQEKINSIEDMDDKILFEMDHTSKDTIRDMVEWNYENPDFIEIKYEDLIQDYDLKLFHEIFTFLGFPGSAIPSLLNIAFNKSIFSGQLNNIKHIRSGKAKQWTKNFKPVHKEKFIDLYGDLLIRLGYEEDNSWAE